MSFLIIALIVYLAVAGVISETKKMGYGKALAWPVTLFTHKAPAPVSTPPIVVAGGGHPSDGGPVQES